MNKEIQTKLNQLRLLGLRAIKSGTKDGLALADIINNSCREIEIEMYYKAPTEANTACLPIHQ